MRRDDCRRFADRWGVKMISVEMIKEWRRKAEKEAKAQAEAERLATLAKHKRELEKARMMEQYAKGSKGKASGGMSATVDENGKLVWQ